MVEPLISNVKKSRFYQEITQERDREIATAMVKKNMSVELISELTGLSKEDVLEMSRELADHKN